VFKGTLHPFAISLFSVKFLHKASRWLSVLSCRPKPNYKLVNDHSKSLLSWNISTLSNTPLCRCPLWYSHQVN